jgi:phosphoglycerol transferase
MLYAATAVIAFFAAFAIMHLWQMRLNIPLYYANGGDELVTLIWVKAMIDDGWYQTVTHLGAPIGMSFGDFPVGALLHMSVLKMLTLIVRDAGAALNLYFLAGFSLIAVSAAYVLRRLGRSWPAALMVSIVYAVLPMRFYRNEAHLAYAQYYLVPVLVLAILWVLRGHQLFDLRTRRPTGDGYIYLFGLVAVALDNQYVAVFGMVFLTLAAIASFIRTHSRNRAFAAAVGILVLFVCLEVSILPSTLYVMQHGTNGAAVVRPRESAEVYALTLAQLVLPVQSHRIPQLAAARSYFDAQIPSLVNENSAATLGILGALGFVGSIGALLLMRSENRHALWPDLARLNVGAFLLATLGGAGAIISYYFVPDLRGYNRFSTVIAFVSLAAVATALDAIGRRWPAATGKRHMWCAALVLVGVLAVADQTSALDIPPYAADRLAFSEDANFADALEERLPPNAALYQLPYVTFPESPPIVHLGSWDQTALYLHSHTLRYSFGVTRGRLGDAWQQNVDALPPRQFLEQVVLAGFDGVLVYRTGYEDRGSAREASLTALLGQRPLVGEGGAVAFFDLSRLRARYLAKVGPSVAARASSGVLNVEGPRDEAVASANRQIAALLGDEVTAEFTNGCYRPESNANSRWHWCGNSSDVILYNASGRSRTVKLRYSLKTAAPAAVAVRAGGVPRSFRASPSGSAVEETLVVPPGSMLLRFSTSATPLVAPGDPRRLVLQISNFEVEAPAK